MARVDWISGHLNPPNSGEFYVIEEVQQDMGEVGWKKGEIEITTDYFDANKKEWQEIGKDNPYWKVVAWADMLRPDVPPSLRDKVKMYFGIEVGKDDE